MYVAEDTLDHIAEFFNLMILVSLHAIIGTSEISLDNGVFNMFKATGGIGWVR